MPCNHVIVMSRHLSCRKRSITGDRDLRATSDLHLRGCQRVVAPEPRPLPARQGVNEERAVEVTECAVVEPPPRQEALGTMTHRYVVVTIVSAERGVELVNQRVLFLPSQPHHHTTIYVTI